MQRDGKPVIAVTYTGVAHPTLTRFTESGALDTSFDIDGHFVHQLPDSQWGVANDVALDTEGRLYAAGHGSANGYQIAVIRASSSGVADTSFGSGGLVQWDLTTGNDQARRITVSPDGLIYLTVHSPGSTDEDASVGRLLSSGTRDPQFGTAGSWRTTSARTIG